jgi:hypothetical protein
MDIIEIKRISKRFGLSENHTKKYLLKVSNINGILLMNEHNGKTYVRKSFYDELIYMADKYESLIPPLSCIKNNASDKVPFKNGSYIYFLLDGAEVVYIGQTVNLSYRVQSHLKDKSFDSVNYFEVDKNDRLLIEGLCINDYTPKYNIATLDKYLILIEIALKITM